MKRNCKLFDYFLIFISILSLCYFIVVTLCSRFINVYIMYPTFATFILFYSIYELKNNISLLSKLSPTLNYLIKGTIIFGISLFLIIEGLIINERNKKYNQTSDYIIVLGARLNNNRPSQSLQYRLDETVKYHQRYNHTKIIVSGGRGNGENISEARAMKNYLIKKGIPENLIIEEDKSTNTNENIIYSKKILDSLENKQYSVTIITNGFHCFRSKLLASKHNLTAYTYSAKENLVTAPHYYIREFFGCLKDLLLS